jgi:hypothetical protein
MDWHDLLFTIFILPLAQESLHHFHIEHHCVPRLRKSDVVVVMVVVVSKKQPYPSPPTGSWFWFSPLVRAELIDFGLSFITTFELSLYSVPNATVLWHSI